MRQFTDRGLNRRTVAEIQRKIVKRGKRSMIARLFHARNDKEMIAAWRLNLNRILHVFNVRSVITARLLLINCSQTELAVITHLTVSDIHRDVTSTQTAVSHLHRDILNAQAIVTDTRHDVTSTHTIISNVVTDVVNTHNIVSDIHRTIVKSQEGADGVIPKVSVASGPFITQWALITLPRLRPGQ